MKKLLLALLSVSFLARAEEEMESVGEQMADAMEGMQSMADEVISHLSWKVKLMLYWNSMSLVHKMIIVGLVVVFVLWILCKIMHRRKDSCCK
ncbi:hypothetical protein KBB68_02440 [Candidatus Babeliales bacterium]|nr:hypothetical protein [Candidatus Babeliales bacterium]